jgi:hypothetical protein
LVLIEFVVLCLPYLWAFTYPITDPPKPIKDASGAQPTDNFCSFFCRVLNVFDVFGVLTYKDGENAPLTGGASNKL